MTKEPRRQKPKRKPYIVADVDLKSAKGSSIELTEEQLEEIAGGPGGNPWTPRVS